MKGVLEGELTDTESLHIRTQLDHYPGRLVAQDAVPADDEVSYLAFLPEVVIRSVPTVRTYRVPNRQRRQ